MATGGRENTPDEIFNFKCTPCAKKNRNREAVKYCVECQGYCCRSCVDIHEDFPALEGHQLLDKSDFKSTGKTSDLPEVPTVRCNVHTVKVMDMYCVNHDVVGCTNCMALDHRSCTDVKLIPDIIGANYNKTVAETASRELHDKIENLNEIVDTRVSILKELEKSKTEAIVAIKDFKKEMEPNLQKLEKESINDVEEENRKQQKIIKEEKKMAETKIEILKKSDTDLRQSEANQADAFVKMKVSQEKVKDADDFIRSLRSSCNAKIIFENDVNIADILRQAKSFGKVSIRSSTVVEPRTTLYSNAGTCDMNIRLPNDKNVCTIVGLCLTDTGTMLLTDYSNNKLKRVDVTRWSEIDQCDFSDTPSFVCATDKDEAAVTFSNNKIQFVSLGKQMKPTRQLEMGHACFGIAYKEEKLYITDGSHCLYIYDMTGTLLETVSQDSTGKHLFISNRQVAFSDNGDKIFVIDWKNRIIILDNAGKHIKTVCSSELTLASAICSDGRGNVFVFGNYSHNIVQIGQDGNEIGVISKDEIKHPLSACFDQKQKKLFIGLSNSDQLKVITLR